jgi:Domain of unknown function (DUF4304)
MNAVAFRKGLSQTLLGLGFKAVGKSLRRDQSDVSVLVSFQRGFGDQCYIVIGFWLHSLGVLATDRVEQTHMYFRLESLLPDRREMILTAGALDDPNQPACYDFLRAALASEGATMMQDLGTEAGLRRALLSSRLSRGLVRGEARKFLEAQ